MEHRYVGILAHHYKSQERKDAKIISLLSLYDNFSLCCTCMNLFAVFFVIFFFLKCLLIANFLLIHICNYACYRLFLIDVHFDFTDFWSSNFCINRMISLDVVEGVSTNWMLTRCNYVDTFMDLFSVLFCNKKQENYINKCLLTTLHISSAYSSYM